MKILYLITELDIGGAERTLHTLATAMVERGHEVQVACLTGRGEVGEWLRRDGVHVHYLDCRPWWPPGIFFSVRRLVREFRPEVLHAFLFHANIVGRFVGWRERVPATICAVRVEDRERSFRLWLDGATHRMMHAQTCVSESACRFTHEQSGIPLEKLFAIPNGVVQESFEMSRGAFRQQLGLSDETPLIAAVGRLEKQKGMDYLLEAAADVSGGFPDAVLAIVGAGPDEERLKERAGKLGLGDVVRFIGWTPDVPQILVDADVFVLASLWEGMPNVVLEAMAARCAVVATEVGGCPEIIIHEESGLLVPPAQSKALADSMRRLLADGKLRKRLAEDGRRRVEEKFSIGTMVESNENLYRRLVSGDGETRGRGVVSDQ